MKVKTKKIYEDVKTKIKFTFPNEVRVIANFFTLSIYIFFNYIHRETTS